MALVARRLPYRPLKPPFILAAVLLVMLETPLAPTEAQRRRATQRRPTAKTTEKNSRDYSAFKHETHRAPRTKLVCSSCHNITSVDAPDVISAATNTTIKGFPYHDSCVGCHRATPPQFFRSSTPVVCRVCHTRSSPRLTAREMSAFPKSAEIRSRELVGYFAHGSREHRNATRDCSACHSSDERQPVAIKASGNETPYLPAAGTFRKLPAGHASCFLNCHWDKDEPKKENCAGCHFTSDVMSTKKGSLLSADTGGWLKDWPREWPRRLSLKFNHDSKNHREADNPELVCTVCHNRIRQSEPLLTPDVPIATCAASGCHFERTSKTSIRKEMLAEEDDIAEGRNNAALARGGQNSCTGCHTQIIGSASPPCSHYLLFGDKYFTVADYPKSAKQLLERCKK